MIPYICNKGMALIIAITVLRSFRIATSQRGIKRGFSNPAETMTSNKPNILKGDLLRKVSTPPLNLWKWTRDAERKPKKTRFSGGKPQSHRPSGQFFIGHMLHCTSHQQRHHQAPNCHSSAMERWLSPNADAFVAVLSQRRPGDALRGEAGLHLFCGNRDRLPRTSTVYISQELPEMLN